MPPKSAVDGSRLLVWHLLSSSGGALAFYLLCVARGWLPLWWGPERRRWSRPRCWSDPPAAAAIASIQASGAREHHPIGSSRNFLRVSSSTPERRVRYRLFFDSAESKLVGLVHFGADCEGPPGSVHGGCTATFADAALGICAFKHLRRAAVTANLDVNYRRRIPLGSTCAVEVLVDLERSAGRKLFLSFALHPIGERQQPFIEGGALFIRPKLALMLGSKKAA